MCLRAMTEAGKIVPVFARSLGIPAGIGLHSHWSADVAVFITGRDIGFAALVFSPIRC